MAFDEKKYKKIFESRYGSGSFDSGLSDARNIGRLKVQADIAKQDYMTRVRAAQKIAKAKKAAEDMGAQDVVNAFIREQQDKENVQASNSSLKATNPIKGAGTTGESYWASKGIPVGYGSSKPTPKAPDKKWVNPYTRDDLKQALAAIKKAKDTTTQDSYARKFNTIGTNKGSSISAYDMMQTFQKKADPNNTPAGTTRFYDTLQTKGYNSTMKKRQEDFMMDPAVSTQHDKYLQQQKLAKEKEKAQVQRANDTLAAIQQDATRRNVYNSGTGNFLQEAERGIARGANAITLGSLGELYKKLHNGEESQQLMDRKGKAGWLDKGSDFAGSVVPFLASDGLLGGVGALGKLGAKGVAGKVGELALRGAGSGAIVSAGQEGVKAGFNPHQFDPKQALENVALNTALGAVANPLLHGAGKGANKLFNLKGQLNQVLKGSTKYNQQDFQKALEEAFAPKGNVSNVVADQAKVMPKPFENKSPVDRLQELLSNTAKQKEVNPLSNIPIKNNATEKPLFMSMGGKVKPTTPKVEQPIKTVEKPVVLRTVKPTKDVNAMSKEELQTVHKQLTEQHQALSRTKTRTNKQKIQEVQDDMAKVEGLLVKLNLQHFGESAHIPSDQLPDTRTHIESKTVKKPINIKNAADTAYIKTVDNLHRLSQFDNTVKKVLDRNLSPSESAHTLGLNSRGSDMISKQILTQNMVNKSGEVVGDSLKDITKDIPKGKVKDFEDYLVNKHAITRMDRGEKVFPDEMQMTSDKSRAIIKNYDEAHPEFKDIAKKYYEYNKNLGKHWLVDTGVLSKDQWEGYLKANPHYVPNNRIFSDMERPLFYGAKKGFANQTNPIKKAVGSQRKIVSPIESTIEHTAQYVKTAKRNEVMQSLINNIKQDPEAFKDWAEIVPTDKTPESVMETLQKEGVDGVLENLNKGFDQKPDLAKGNIVTGIIDGQKVHVKVNDPHLLDAITNLSPKAQNLVIHSIGQVTRVMKNLTTGINPVFSLTRNIFRDIPTALSNSKSTNNPLTFSKDLVGSVVSVIKNDELYRSFKAVGGGHASPLSSDVNLLKQSKRSILPREKGLLNATKHYGGKLLGGLENLNNAVESAPRLAEFKRFAGDSYDSKMKALYEANDVTVNFNKYGNLSKEIDSVIPYFNAAVQGLDKTGRALLNPKTAPKVATKAFAAITIPSIIAFVANHNNPDYQKLSNYIKDNNIVIPKGDGTFFKIPVPREYGVLFHSGVTRLLRKWVDKDPKAFENFGKTVLTNFSLPTRSTLAPFNDIRSNKNFMDAPIIPGDLANLSPQYQYDSKTSELSKKLGSMFGTSPKNTDYLIKSYSGVLGELGLPLMTKGSTVGETLKQQVTADPAFSNDIQSNFYDTKTKLDQAHNDLTKQGVKSKDLNEQLRNIFNKKSLLMGKVRKQMKEIQNDSSIPASERLKKLRVLQEQINQIAQSGNQLVR